jgi:hypothetical protein
VREPTPESRGSLGRELASTAQSAPTCIVFLPESEAAGEFLIQVLPLDHAFFLQHFT